MKTSTEAQREKQRAREAIEVCGGKDSVRTYEELLQMLCGLGIQGVIGALDRHRPMA